MEGPKGIGSTWVTLHKGKEWPVVLCDDEIPPKAFIESRPNPFLCPAILLGKHIFVWVKVNDLRDFDPCRDYSEGLPKFNTEDPVSEDDDHIVQEKLRRKAFRVDALQFKNHLLWNNYILSKSEARKTQNKAQMKQPRDLYEEAGQEVKSRTKSKRKDRSGSQSGRVMLTPESMPRKRGRDGDVRRSIEIIEDSDEESLVRDSRKLSDPFQSTGDFVVGQEFGSEDDDDEAQLEKIRQKNIQYVKDHIPSTDRCHILVGTEYTPFLASRVATGKCDYLSDREKYDDELGSYINLYEHTDIEKDRFEPIGQYLYNGDFTPRFRKTVTIDQFEDAIFMPEQRDQSAQHIVTTYHTAAKISFEDMQKLCLRKLRLLTWISPDVLLILAKIVHRTNMNGTEVEEEMFEWLADQIAGQFWHIVETQYMTLSRVMRDDADLSQRVFLKLAENPAIGGQGMDDD